MGATITNLAASIETVRSQAIQNTTEINNLNTKNHDLTLRNEHLTNKLQNRNLNKFEEEIKKINNHLNSEDQYLRVNNLEIVGLPEAELEETNEEILISALNILEGLNKQIIAADINISHPIPTKRCDNKRVAVVKFVSRKSKFDILSAKKANRNLKFRGNDIFINEHLSPVNRALFASATEKK